MINNNYITIVAVHNLANIMQSYPSIRPNFKLLYALSVKQVNIAMFMHNIHDIQLTESTVYIMQISNAVRIQSELNPHDDHIKQLRERVETIAKK